MKPSTVILSVLAGAAAGLTYMFFICFVFLP